MFVGNSPAVALFREIFMRRRNKGWFSATDTKKGENTHCSGTSCVQWHPQRLLEDELFLDWYDPGCSSLFIPSNSHFLLIQNFCCTVGPRAPLGSQGAKEFIMINILPGSSREMKVQLLIWWKKNSPLILDQHCLSFQCICFYCHCYILLP